MCQWPTEVLGEACLLPLLPQPPRLDGDLQLQVQFSLIGEGRRTHRAGVVQEAETGEAEETCRGPGAKVHLSLPTLLPGSHPTSSLGGVLVKWYTVGNFCNINSAHVGELRQTWTKGAP